jgi:hypothetical protein
MINLQRNELDGHPLVFGPVPVPGTVAIALQVTRWPIQSAQGEDGPAIVGVHGPAALALGCAFADLRPAFQANGPLVVSDATGEEVPAATSAGSIFTVTAWPPTQAKRRAASAKGSAFGFRLAAS